MSNSNTYKALIATTFILIAVIFLGFTVHIKKQSKLVAETFYEMDAEAVKIFESGNKIVDKIWLTKTLPNIFMKRKIGCFQYKFSELKNV